MEKRTILAVLLSVVILISWSYFFQSKKKAPPKGPFQEQPVPQQPSPAEKLPEAPPTPPLQQETLTDVRGQEVVVETDLFSAVLSTDGGIITSWKLKKYADKNGRPVVLLRNPGTVRPLQLLFDEGGQAIPRRLQYRANTQKLLLSAQGNTRGEVILAYADATGSMRKKFVFHNDDYRVDLTVEAVNTPSFLLPLGTDFGLFDKTQREHKGPVLLVDSEREEFNLDHETTEYFTGKVSWIAQEDKYFTAAIAPVTPVEAATIWYGGAQAEIAYKMPPGKHEFILYAGPKEYDRLKELNVSLEHIIDFGWFAFLAMPLFWVLKYFYGFLGNYGWAIILLTIVVRIPFIPILHKSQQSMKKMQKIQPMMAEIKEKYKKDAQKMQKEMMEIYKKHKVNPVGGCLPMLLQIPVFIALYNVLLKAIELRGAPFALWITDLSVKDPYYVLPVVMGATMVLQQKMTPTAMDPKQAKIMMLMPIVFTFMFLTFPAGLVLYWLVNNVFGIAQQYYANKKAET